MRPAESKILYSLVAGCLVLAAVTCLAVSQDTAHTSMLESTEGGATKMELASSGSALPRMKIGNPFEDPELREPYDVKTDDELKKSKTDFKGAQKELKKGFKKMKAVLEDLEKQDVARDALMTEAVDFADQIKSIRHLMLMVKDETAQIRSHEDTKFVFKNPFGTKANPPDQDVTPFEKQADDLMEKTDKINKDLKKLIKKANSCRNDAILLDAKLYDEVHSAKQNSHTATDLIHRHFNRVEMFNHKDYDIVHRVDNKLNLALRKSRHKLKGMFNTAKDMSARQPNEASEVRALCVDLLIVVGETQDRLKRMNSRLVNIKYERKRRAKIVKAEEKAVSGWSSS